MQKYHHIFFDLDHTLWDFEKNASETLTDLYRQYELMAFNQFSELTFIEKFRQVNYQLWDLFNKGSIEKAEIREKRFNTIFTELGLLPDQIPADFGEDYIKICPRKSNTMPHALEVLEYLHDKYVLCIITNGFDDVQEIKLSSANIKKYFKEIITSESIGSKKPQKEIFEYALKLSRAEVGKSIMVGDNLYTDIEGARGVNMDQIYYNPNDLSHKEKVTYEINCLSELSAIL